MFIVGLWNLHTSLHVSLEIVDVHARVKQRHGNSRPNREMLSNIIDFWYHDSWHLRNKRACLYFKNIINSTNYVIISFVAKTALFLVSELTDKEFYRMKEVHAKQWKSLNKYTRSTYTTLLALPFLKLVYIGTIFVATYASKRVSPSCE